MKRFTSILSSILLCCFAGCATTAAVVQSSPEEDIEAARAVFLANIQAIQKRDKDAYLAVYRQDDLLLRVGGEGVEKGFAGLAEGAAATGSEDWPEKLVADDIELHWISPGLVYGAYRYTVTINGETSTGLSERLFILKDDRWQVAVTTAFDVAPAEEKGQKKAQEKSE